MTARIGVDAHALDGKKQGVQTFIRQFFKELIEIDRTNQYYLYCFEPERHREDFPSVNVHFRKLKSHNPIARLMLELPIALRRDNIDIGIFQYVSPPFSLRHKIVVVHDVLPITHPAYFPRLFRIRYDLLTRLSIATAASVVTVSATSQREIYRAFNYPIENIHVLGYGPSFPEKEILAEVAPSSINLPAELVYGRYVLAVGRIEKRKNIDLLIRAFLKADLPDVRLAIVGKQDLGYQLPSSADPRVVLLGSVEDHGLLDIYRGAGLFVFPSVAEGFGIPLLDAVLFGLPALSSGLTSMPEAAGSLAVYFDPIASNAEDDLADRLRQHFTVKPIERPTMQQRLEHAHKFSWKAGAQGFLNVLQNVQQG